MENNDFLKVVDEELVKLLEKRTQLLAEYRTYLKEYSKMLNNYKLDMLSQSISINYYNELSTINKQMEMLNFIKNKVKSRI